MTIKNVSFKILNKTEEGIRFNRIKFIFDTLLGSKNGKEFVREMDVDKYYNDGFSNYKKFPEDYQFMLDYHLSNNKREFIDKSTYEFKI